MRKAKLKQVLAATNPVHDGFGKSPSSGVIPSVAVPFGVSESHLHEESVPPNLRRIWLRYQRLQRRLEETQAAFSKATDRLREEEPGIFETRHSLAGPVLPLFSLNELRVGERNSGPTVAGRDALIRRYRDLSTLKICQKLDFDGIPVPETWQKGCDETLTFVSAYKNQRLQNRVHKLISVGRRRPGSDLL